MILGDLLLKIKIKISIKRDWSDTQDKDFEQWLGSLENWADSLTRKKMDYLKNLGFSSAGFCKSDNSQDCEGYHLGPAECFFARTGEMSTFYCDSCFLSWFDNRFLKSSGSSNNPKLDKMLTGIKKEDALLHKDYIKNSIGLRRVSGLKKNTEIRKYLQCQRRLIKRQIGLGKRSEK